MKIIKSALEIVKKINFILTNKQKKSTIIVFLSMVICSLLELLGVSSIYPFLQIMLNENEMKTKWYLGWIYAINPGIKTTSIFDEKCCSNIL